MATVIKSTLGARNALPIAFNFEDVAEHASQHIGDAQSKAAEIIAEAKRQAAEVTRRAEEGGRQAAMRAVEQVLDQKIGHRMETLLPALERVIADLTDAKQAWLRHWENSTVTLATKIAEKVIRRELQQVPEIKIDLIREALEMAAGGAQLKIALHPADFETLGKQVQRLSQEIARTAQTEIVADGSVTIGGCRLETRHGVIDQQIESQLNRIAAELIGSSG